MGGVVPSNEQGPLVGAADINLGDLIADGTDWHGGAANVAA